jgi:hypothetical protein
MYSDLISIQLLFKLKGRIAGCAFFRPYAVPFAGEEEGYGCDDEGANDYTYDYTG